MKCTRPPKGWECSREDGHTGPCAASPIVQHAPEATYHGNKVQYNANQRVVIELFQTVPIGEGQVTLWLGDLKMRDGNFFFRHYTGAEFNLNTDHKDTAHRRALACCIRANRRLSKALSHQVSREERKETFNVILDEA